MNSYYGFLTPWEPMPMMIPTQRVVPILIPLQVHSSVASPRSATAFDLTMMMQTNRNPHCFQDWHLHVLSARLSSLIPRSSPGNEALNELQQPSTPSWFDLRALLDRLPSLSLHSRLNTDGETDLHLTMPAASRTDAIIGILSSLFRSQPHTRRNRTLATRNAG